MFRAEWEKYITDKVPVTIRYRREKQLDPMWAITVDEDPEFWLDAFEDRAGAIRFCREHELPYKMEDA